MPLPTLRQLNGFVLIVNTLLPFLFVLAIYLMWVLSIQSFRVNTCSSLNHSARVITAIDKAKSSQALIKHYEVESNQTVVPGGGDCKIEEEFNDLLVVRVYETVKNNVDKQVKAVGKKVDGVKNKVARAVPKLPDIRIGRVPPLKILKFDLSKALNSVIRFVNAIDNNVNRALSTLASVVTNAFTNIVDPERKRIYLEIEKTSYRQAVVLDTVRSMLSAILEAFEKFYWLLLVLVIWLPISYIFWAHHRLTLGWKMLQGQ